MNSRESVGLAASAGGFRSRDVLVVAAWFGLVAGLLESSGLLLLERLGWATWNMALWGVTAEILWISPAFDLLLFSSVGLALIALARAFPRLPLARLAVFLFSFLAFFDWLALTGRIRHRGVLVLAIGLAVVSTRWFGRNQARALRFWRRSLPWVVVIVVLVVFGIQGGLWLQEQRAVAKLPAAPPNSPNVLVIVVDTLRSDHLSSHGYGRLTTPNLDRLAEQGVLFENAFATSSWSPPSHASLLTGRYLYEHDVDTEPFDGRYPTLADALRARGYRTGAFSANTGYFSRRMGFGQGFTHFEDYFHSPVDMARRTLYGREFEKFVLQRMGSEATLGRRRTSSVNRSFLRWVDRAREKPFFAFLNYFDAHWPYLPPEPYRNRFTHNNNPGGAAKEFIGHKDLRMTPGELQSEIDAYDGAIAYVDHHIGQLLAGLRGRGLGRNTLVVITSDHGEALGEHGFLYHRNSVYLGEIRVPLIFWGPGRVPAGVRVAQPVSNAALPATLMELVAARNQALFPGPPLNQLWAAPESYPDWPYPLAELSQVPFGSQKRLVYHGSMKSLVSPKWHYIVHEKFGEELYDWAKDPGELNNLAATPEGKRITSDFAARLENLLAHSRQSE